MTLIVQLRFAAFTLLAMLIACAQGLKIDFSKLALHRNPYYTSNSVKRNDGSCMGNPCPSSQPFMCRSSPKCVELKFLCDGTPDCDDNFDEDPAVCNAASRPSLDDLVYFLQHELWMMPKFFNGASIDLVAHALTVAPDMHDLAMQVGMTDENVELMTDALVAINEGDERPLRKMGMDPRMWQEVQYVFQKIIDSGFQY